eukprot:9430642-Alexandrium_andersonii.AAC.1
MSQRLRHRGPPHLWSWCDVGSARTHQATCNMQHHVSLKRHASHMRHAARVRHAGAAARCATGHVTCDTRWRVTRVNFGLH